MQTRVDGYQVKYVLRFLQAPADFNSRLVAIAPLLVVPHSHLLTCGTPLLRTASTEGRRLLTTFHRPHHANKHLKSEIDTPSHTPPQCHHTP